ncbi:hypothetical protein [Nocardioides marmoribigeumensis]|uniref:Uncharacterized protein n=1 Tax=Nocardioides marmoribigeumensis TaxID=433649 RepID=A0ABU2C1D1_9ACTN|nr:hypothetical protein [Nocardioides marmoribigeumensis]MDR7364452.1 hypothetical protein [Nocardioides marmoribigeumensis]
MEQEHPSWQRWQAELAGSRAAPERRQVGLHDDPDAYAAVGLSLWCDAWLHGAVSLDDAADHVASGDAVHLVDTGSGPEPLIIGLGRLRALGAVSAGAALPVPGDPVGLAGPAGFNQAALEAEEAVLLEGAGLGLVPERVGSSVTWRALPATTRRQTIDPGDADRELRAALPRAADRLAALDVARWRPEVADALLNLRREQHLDLPPHVAARAARMLVLGLRCLDIVALASQDDGGSVTAAEAGQRRAALDDLASAARRAVVAATCAPSY